MGRQPLISVIHPTARVSPSEAFPQGWKASHDAFHATCSNPADVEYILVVHQSRWDEFQQSGLYRLACSEARAWGSLLVVKNSGRDCSVDQVNVGAAHSRGKVLFGTQDDLYPPAAWDRLVLSSFPNFEREIVVSFSSGSPSDPDLFVVGAATRKRFERQGYVLHPDFESMFADNYYTFEAKRDADSGKCLLLERYNVEFEHRHPMFGKGKTDAVYLAQNAASACQQGKVTLDKLTTGKKILGVCLPGEWFPNAWVAAWTSLFGHAQSRCIPIPIFGYTSNVHCTRMELAEDMLNLRPKVDYILWLDDDNVLAPSQLDLLLQDLEQNPELDAVVGWCWCDRDPNGTDTYVMSCGLQDENMVRLPFTMKDFQAANGPLVTINWSGFPCVLLRREMLERLTPAAFRPILRPEVKFGFTSEDTSFFWNARQAGMTIAVDFRVKVPHVKWRAIEPDLGLRLPDAPGIKTQYGANGLEKPIQQERATAQTGPGSESGPAGAPVAELLA